MNSKNLVLVVILVLAAIGISLFILRGPETTRKWTVEESRIIAENFIMNSPTYKFDGFDLRYVETQTMRCPYCWGFVFEFQSRHAGYGGRTGKILLQVITEHKARVVVDHGKVISAILDEKWSELNQGFLDRPKELIISLERTECFGTCPAYGLTVYGNGTVVYEGKNFVKIEGIKTITISKEEIRELISEFEKIDFFSISRDRYIAIDLPNAIVSITIDGRTRTIENSYGAYFDDIEVRKLIELENKIDEITNSKQWIMGEKVSLIPGKGVYSTGEEVKFTFNSEGQKIYSENFGQWQIYKFENNEWKSIPTGVLFGCRPTDCINGMVIQKCIDPGMTKCHEILDPVSDSWDQEYWTTEERVCENKTYTVDVKSQVKAGRYKMRYNYAIDSSCEKYSYVEKEFTIEEIPIQDVTITTDKTEYEKWGNISISLKNNANNQVKYFENIGCGAEIFADNEWKPVYNKSSCEWGQELLLPAREIKKVDSVFPLEMGKYRLALFYRGEEVLKLKEIGNVKCDNIPADLENLLINGKWVKNEVTPKDMCFACGCRATDKNVFSVDGASIDVTSVSCYGKGYTINYKGGKFSCRSEKFKDYITQAHPSPSENWGKAYSNEFTIKEITESVEVLNKEFILTLDSNPTTGYNWEAQFDKNILELKEKTFEPSPTGLIGAGGKEKFVFIPVKTGETTIKLMYKRPWEDKPIEEKKFRFKIIEEKTECTKDSDCGTGGCSGQVCTTAEKAKGVITTCEFLPEYGCLGLTSCGCVNGKCQWKENSAYSDCMDKLKSG